jgi:hypothetical protein
MSDLEILQLKQFIQKELLEINVILEKISLELAEVMRLSQHNGRPGIAVKRTKESFAALNIKVENSGEQGEVHPTS